MSKILHYSEGIVTKQNIFENLNAVNPDTNELKNPPQPEVKKNKPRKRKSKTNKANKENSNNSDTSIINEVASDEKNGVAVQDADGKPDTETEIPVESRTQDSVDPPTDPVSDESPRPNTLSRSPAHDDVPSTLAEEGQPSPPQLEQPAPPTQSVRYSYPTMQFVNSSFKRGRGGRGGRGGGGGRGEGDYRRDSSGHRPGQGGEKFADNPARGHPGSDRYSSSSTPAYVRPYDRSKPVHAQFNHQSKAPVDKFADERSNEPSSNREKTNKFRKDAPRKEPQAGKKDHDGTKADGQNGEQSNGKPVKETSTTRANEAEGPKKSSAGKSQNTSAGPDGSSQRAVKDQKSPGKDQKSPGKDKSSGSQKGASKVDPKLDSKTQLDSKVEQTDAKTESKNSPKGSKPARNSPKGEAKVKSEKSNPSGEEAQSKSGVQVLHASGADGLKQHGADSQDSQQENSRPPRNSYAGGRGYRGDGYADRRERRYPDKRDRAPDNSNYREKEEGYQRERGNRDHSYSDQKEREGNGRGYSRAEDRDRGYSRDQRGDYAQSSSRKYYDGYQERGDYRRSFNSEGGPTPSRRGRGGNYPPPRSTGERRNPEAAPVEEESGRYEGSRNGPRGNNYRGNRGAQVNGGYDESHQEYRREAVENGDASTGNSASFSRNKQRRYGRGNSRGRSYPKDPVSLDPSSNDIEHHPGDGTQRTTPQESESQVTPLVNGSGEEKDISKDADGKSKRWSDESWQHEEPRKPSPYEEQTNRVKVTHEPVQISEGPAYNQTIQEVNGDLLGAPVEYALAVAVSEDFRMPLGLPAQFRNEFRRLDILLDQNVRMGNVATLATPCNGGSRLIFYLVMKKLSHSRAMLKPLRSCLINLREACEREGVRSLALPQLGSGPDRLDWRDVRPLLEEVFEGSGIHVLVYMQNEDQDYTSKSTKVTGAKLVLEQKPVVEIEEFTSIIVLSSLDRELNSLVLDSLDGKFHILEELDAQLASASVGSVINLKRSNYFINVFVVSPSASEPFKFETIFKCLSAYKKHLHKDRIEYVAFEAMADRQAANEMLNEKLVSFMKNSLPYSIQLHVCWPEYVEDRHSIARTKPPASHMGSRIENYNGRYHGNAGNHSNQSAYSTSSHQSNNNDRPLEIDSNRHFPKL